MFNYLFMNIHHNQSQLLYTTSV